MSALKEKLRKITKKTLKFLGWTTGILVILLVAAYFAFRSPAVQTWVCQKLGNYLADELDTEITIGGVDIKFFTSVELEDIYVEDQHGDTLLDASSLVVNLSQFDYDAQHVRVDNITLTDANIKIKKYEGEKGLNFRFFVKYFESTDTIVDTTGVPWDVELGYVKLENCRFAFIDTRWNDVDRGMDYENIHLREIFATFERIELMGDSTSLYMSELKAKEMCGLDLQHMESRMIVADTFMKFNDLIIQTPGSDIKGWIGFHYHSFDDVEDDFIHKVKMDGHFSESVIEMGDIAYFSPVLLGIQMKVMLTGDVVGTAEKLKTKNVDLRFGKSSRIVGNFGFDGLPDIENTDMNFRIKESSTNYEDLTSIPVDPFDDTSFLSISSRIAVLGTLGFSGTIEGFTHDFVAHGKLRTGQGDLVLENLVMSQDSTAEDFNWEGILTAQEFNIGAFLDVPEMGHITGTANMIGYGTDVPSIVASMNANFSAIEYGGYRYSNIVVTEGQLAKEVFDGVVDMHDPNIDLHYEGFVDFKNPDDPVLSFDARIDSADFGKLGFADTSQGLIVSSDVQFDMHGSNIDNLDGYLTLNNLDFRKDKMDYHLSTMGLIAGFNKDGSRYLTFNSDFLALTMQGRFEVMKVNEAITDVMSAYLPAYFPPRLVDPKKKTKETPQTFSLNVLFLRNTDAVKAFVPDLMVAPRTSFDVQLDQSNRALSVRNFYCDSLGYGSYEFYGFNRTSLIGNNGKAELKMLVDRVQVNDSTGFDDFQLIAKAGSNKLETFVGWNNKSKEANQGSLNFVTVFENQKSLNVEVTDGTFMFNDSAWQLDPGKVLRVDSSVITINNMVVHSGAQSFAAKGRISNNPLHFLDVSISRFNLSSLNFFTEANDITLGGELSGNLQLSNLYNAPTFNGNMTFDEFFFNKQRIGDGEAVASYLPDKQGVLINTTFWRLVDDAGNRLNNIELRGWYYPKREENSLDLHAQLSSIPLDLIQPVLKDYCSKVVGKIGGNIDITGSLGKPELNGSLDVGIKMVRIDYLGVELVQWRKTQRIVITPNAFEFDNFVISDNQRDTAVINGQLFHDNFSKFQFDMYFEFDHFLVMNTTEKDNEDYYGRVYATGFMDVFGFADKKIGMNINAKAEGVNHNGTFIKSDFNIPMTSTNETGDNEFIRFEPDTTRGGLTPAITHEKVFNDNGIEMNLNLEITKDVNVHVIFDETVGDELSATGDGALQIGIKANGDFTMTGAYTVEQGQYMFTLKNIIYKKFDLQKGGVISWNGDPEDARIDADAIYLANASVEPFFPYDTTTAAYQQNYPVNVVMHLDGKLVNPGLSFDIEIPSAETNIQETVRSYTQSELEMNRQVLSLMVLNSFMTPAEFRDGSEGTGAGGAGTTLLSNFVSGTLNNWLSQISENANVKFDYRPNDDMSLQEVKLALGTQLMNNRLTFDVAGSIQNANQTQTQGGYNQYVDVNVEYKVTEDGKVRLRAFNRGNEQSALMQGATHTQGAGVFYREDFDSFKELFKRYKDAWNAPANSKEKNEQKQNPSPDGQSGN
jgi:hypothetical protein